MQFNPALRPVLDDFHREIERCRVTGPGDGAADLETGAEAVQRLALFEGEEMANSSAWASIVSASFVDRAARSLHLVAA